MALVDFLIKDKWLKTPEIIEAFRKINREDFLPKSIKELADFNGALSIGRGQTISQPLVVAFMLELLRPEKGNKILDIGSGSGWTTALLSEIVGENGKVIALEIIQELKEFGEKNVSKYNFINKGIAEFLCQDGSEGCKDQAPYDRILVSASAQTFPERLKEQVKTEGRIVLPIKNSIWLFEKINEKEFFKKEYPGFSFVPLV